MHEALRDRDLPYPCTEWRLATEAGETLEDDEHGLLEQVLSERATADDAPDQPERSRRHDRVDVCPRAFLATAGLQDDLLGDTDFYESVHWMLRCTRGRKGRVKNLYSPAPRRCGGTGRRAGLKIRFWRQSVGSIPSTGTNPLQAAFRSPPLLVLEARSRGMLSPIMKFCSNCGARVEQRIPEGDNLPRFVCADCGSIHYQNPRLVVGCVPEHEGRILLCLRAIEPRRGFWTVPAGFMENGETLQQAAARESFEEALASVEIGSLLAIVNVTHAHQVHVFFRATLASPSFGPGPESLEVKLLDPVDIPWRDIAFRSTIFSLERYLEDRAKGIEQHYFTELDQRRG